MTAGKSYDSTIIPDAVQDVFTGVRAAAYAVD
jgi:hypothetical protein